MSGLGTIRRFARRVLERFPAAEVRFRRHVWSRLSFPESEMRVLSRLPGRPFDVAIDVGAALGGYAWLLGRAARRVIAFEPGPVHADFLERGIAGTNIELVRAAVGNGAGTVPMYTPGSGTNAFHSATLSADNPVSGSDEVIVTQVAQISLDDFAQGRLGPDERVDFLKIDVEGYELPVLEGARMLLARDHPVVLCEIEARHNMDYRKVFDLLRDLGYAAFVRKHGRFERFDGVALETIQRDEDLAYRLSDDYRPETGAYINNFTFEHPQSRVKVTQ